jgi:hypothetical protein
MKRFLILLAACSGAAHAPPVETPPPPPTDSITLAYQPPAVGSRWREVEDMAFDFTMAKIGAVHTSKRVSKTIEIVAVEGPLITAKKVTFEQYREQQVMQGHTNDQPSTLEGQTYLVQDASEGPVVTPEGGRALSPSETEQVLKDVHVGAREGRFERALATKTFRLDEEVELTKDELAALLGDDPLDKARFTMTYRGPDSGLASFDVTIAATSADASSTTTITVTGRVLVDPATSELVDGKLQGPMQSNGQFQAIGTMTMTTHRTML